jgi:hypothetical protein
MEIDFLKLASKCKSKKLLGMRRNTWYVYGNVATSLIFPYFKKAKEGDYFDVCPLSFWRTSLYSIPWKQSIRPQLVPITMQRAKNTQ